MRESTKKIISGGLAFLCCITFTFSSATAAKKRGKQEAVVFLSAPEEQGDQKERIQDLLERARVLQWKGEYDGAYECYNNAIHMSPQDASLYFERGSLSFLRLASFTGKSPGEGGKLSTQEVSLLVQRYCTLALNDFNKAISLDPHIDVFYYMRGSLQIFEAFPCHNLTAAVESFDRAIQLNDSNAIYYMERGKAHVALRRYGQAADDLRRAADIKGHDYHFHHDIGKLYERMGMKKEALYFYKRTMEQAPPDRLEMLNRSLVLLRDGKSEDLIRDYSELIAKRPEVAQLYAMRGHRYKESGKIQEAIDDYSVVVGLQPGNKEIRTERERLFSQSGGKRQTAAGTKNGGKAATTRTEEIAGNGGVRPPVKTEEVTRNAEAAKVAMVAQNTGSMENTVNTASTASTVNTVNSHVGARLMERNVPDSQAGVHLAESVSPGSQALSSRSPYTRARQVDNPLPPTAAGRDLSGSQAGVHLTAHNPPNSQVGIRPTEQASSSAHAGVHLVKDNLSGSQVSARLTEHSTPDLQAGVYLAESASFGSQAVSSRSPYTRARQGGSL